MFAAVVDEKILGHGSLLDSSDTRRRPLATPAIAAAHGDSRMSNGPPGTVKSSQNDRRCPSRALLRTLESLVALRRHSRRRRGAPPLRSYGRGGASRRGARARSPASPTAATLRSSPISGPSEGSRRRGDAPVRAAKSRTISPSSEATRARRAEQRFPLEVRCTPIAADTGCCRAGCATRGGARPESAPRDRRRRSPISRSNTPTSSAP